MKNKGFTLIELLAVILILGIIALIAIPTVTSVVEQSRRGAASSSATQFIKSVEELAMTNELSGNTFNNGYYTAKELIDRGLNIKGTMPDEGLVKIVNGEVSSCSLTYSNYITRCDDDKIVVDEINNVSKFVLSEDNDSNNEYSIGDKICLDTECFYVISEKNGNIRMLAEWNLNVGYEATYNGDKDLPGNLTWAPFYDKNENGFFDVNFSYIKIGTRPENIKQDESFVGYKKLSNGKKNIKGVINFADLKEENYISEKVWDYPGYWNGYETFKLNDYNNLSNSIYDENSNLYTYVENYIKNLTKKSGINMLSGDLIVLEDLKDLGCNMSRDDCSKAPSWIFTTSYWTGVPIGDYDCIYEFFPSIIGFTSYSMAAEAGIRPVITIHKSLIKK